MKKQPCRRDSSVMSDNILGTLTFVDSPSITAWNPNQFTTATRFLSVSPLILALGVEEGISFYRNALDFDLVYRDAEPAQSAIVGRDGVKLHIFANHNKELADWTSIGIEVESIDTLYGRCQENGFVHPNGLLGSCPLGNTRIFDH